jgi:hypothetical protein
MGVPTTREKTDPLKLVKYFGEPEAAGQKVSDVGDRF